MMDYKAYIMQNHQYLTGTQMAEDIGVTLPTLLRYCEVLGVKPISGRDQIKGIILEYYKKYPMAKIGKMVSLKQSSMENYYKELGIKEPDFPTAGAKQTVTARDILSKFQMHGANHCVPDISNTHYNM